MKKRIKWANGEKAKLYNVITRTKSGNTIISTTYERDKWIKEKRDFLIANMTDAEKIVFTSLSTKIKRCAIQQYPLIIDGHMLFIDIYIKKLNIAIEIDGGYHSTHKQKMYDSARDRLLATQGIRVYRIDNDAVFNPSKLKEFNKMLRTIRPRGKFKGFSEEELKYISNAQYVFPYLQKIIF